jgi:tetratricopeptide (TPR) repeat protein
MRDDKLNKPIQISELQISGTPETIPPPTEPAAKGTQRYAFTKFHARGGMGEIWICHDSHLRRDVAIKRLSSNSVIARERFLAEAQVTGQLEHPGIVPIHDLGVDDNGQPYYVMKFVRGRSLKDAIRDYHAKPPRGEVPPELQWRRLLDIFVDVCHAVAYAHSRGVLHRDLKPDNVMLGPFGETVLLDWGLAKARGDGPLVSPVGALSSHASTSGTHTEAGSVIGSPLYMPPEMAEGRINDTDERTDIYLLGATLYEILTGRTPREGKSFDELLTMARTASVLPPRKLAKVPKALSAICVKAMSREKEDRYATAMELATDVQRYLAGAAVSAYREGLLTRAWRAAKRHQLALKRIAVAAIVVLAAGITWSTLRQIGLLRAREEARGQISNFQKLVDEARFYAASSDPTAEHAPYFDASKARMAFQQALAAAAPWGQKLEALPLADQRPALQQQMYELLLLVVQDACLSSQNLAGVPAQLERARQLIPQPSRGWHTLEAQYLRLMNDPDRAAAEDKLADDPNTPSTAFDSFLKGEEFRRRSATETEATPARTDDLEHAIQFYRRAAQQDPRHFWADFQLGRCYMSVGKLSEAVEALGTCIALRPDAPWGFSARGMALGLMHRFDEAHADLNRALQLDPDFRPALLNSGVVFWMQQDDRRALENFQAALQPPDDRRLIEAKYYRAQIYVQQNNTDLALNDLNDLILQSPDFYPGYLLRAQVQLMREAQEPGLEDLNALLKHDMGPDFDIQTPKGLGQRGHLLRRIASEMPNAAELATLGLARQDLESAVRLGGAAPDAYRDLGAVYELLGRNGDAVTAYSSALKLSPRDVPALLDRGWIYQKLARTDDARADFSAAIASDPTSAEAHAGLGYVAAFQGSYGEAQHEAAAALLYGGDDYLILHDVACVYAELLQTDPRDHAAHQSLVIAMLTKAVVLWRNHGTDPDELRLIENEPAFPPSLRNTAEFQHIIDQAKR